MSKSPLGRAEGGAEGPTLGGAEGPVLKLWA